ncbi:MAG: hypothetical protein JKY57_04680 [Kordiimonadaceae bacterium]|nr:hypothetical protein [Kordiimonadaceae bacterium]
MLDRPVSTVRQVFLKIAISCIAALHFTVVSFASPAFAGSAPDTSIGTTHQLPPIKEIATRYIKLILGIGEHEAGYIDAYYGPARYAADAKTDAKSLDALRSEASDLLAFVRAYQTTGDTDPMRNQRMAMFEKQLIAAETRIRMLQGERFTFDEETRLLFDAVAPSVSVKELEATYKKLDKLVKGDGNLQERMVAFKAGFKIPTEKLASVFEVAISECRARTKEHISLPKGESFTKEFVKDKAWSGYNWFQGKANSLIQVNTDLPSAIESAVNLGCHEGYPGHHVFNSLLEQKLVNERGWEEYSVYPLYSPQSFLAEGTASYARHMAFPGKEQQAFEIEVLYPLANLDPTKARAYITTLNALGGLRYARIEGARRYLDGEITREELVNWIKRYNLVSRKRAEQSAVFIEKYRGYVINYTLGSDLTKAYLDKHAGSDHKARWALYTRLISEPFTASMLR